MSGRRKDVGHSKAEKARSRERILNVAARQVREQGLENFSIADLMKSAKLTHGGFYGHFESKEALVSAALDRAMDSGEASFAAAQPAKAPVTVKSIVNRYLSAAHRDNPGEGCAIAALAIDIGRTSDDGARNSMAKRVDSSLEMMAEAFGNGPGASEAAIAAWCTMVGALALSRVCRGTKRSDDILKHARLSILDLEKQLRAGQSQQTGN